MGGQFPVDQGGDLAVLVDEYVYTVEIVMGNPQREVGKLVKPPSEVLGSRFIGDDVFQRRRQDGL